MHLTLHTSTQSHAQGKITAKPHKRKNPARQPRAIRTRKKRDAFMNGTYWHKIEALDHNGNVMKEIGTLHNVKIFEKEA